MVSLQEGGGGFAMKRQHFLLWFLLLLVRNITCFQDVTGVRMDGIGMRMVFDCRRMIASDTISDYDIEIGDTIEVYTVQSGC